MNIIQTSADLEKFCTDLETSNPGYMAVDTEFVREHTFKPKLCLIQIATPDKVGIVDPLAPDINLNHLLPLFLNKSIEKIFHSGRQDLEIFWNLWNFVPTPLFDTQIAAMALGYGDGIGYHSLVHDLLGHELDKSCQHTNWEERPLSEKQLHYAYADVSHLIHVYEEIYRKLKTLGRLDWVQDELLSLSNPTLYFLKPEDAWRRLKLPHQRPKFLYRLQKLAEWRDTQAYLKNLIRGKILKDSLLVEIALRPPQTLSKIKAILSDHASEDLEAIYEILQHCENAPKEVLPKIPSHKPLKGEQVSIFEKLKAHLAETAKELNIVPRLIATKSELEYIVKNPDNDAKIFQGWRYQVFGKKVKDIIFAN